MVTWPLLETNLGQWGQQDSLFCSCLETEASCTPHCDPGPGTVPWTRPPDGCRGGSGTHGAGGPGCWGSQLERKAEPSCPVEGGWAPGDQLFTAHPPHLAVGNLKTAPYLRFLARPQTPSTQTCFPRTRARLSSHGAFRTSASLVDIAPLCAHLNKRSLGPPPSPKV